MTTSADAGGYGILESVAASGSAYGNTIVNPNGGNVGIGTINTYGYKLAVNGTIRAKEIKVEASPWPDYVFKSTYQLKPLSEVKAYIDRNQHLPEMPSAAEIEKDGLSLAKMNKLLVKKVEELTLYLIEKDKQLQNQQEVNQSVTKRLAEIEKYIMRK